MSSGLVVAHLDHTSERGGAEMALARMLNAQPEWSPRLLLPRKRADEVDIFAMCASTSVQRLGPRQPAGASKSAGARAAGMFATRLLGQSAAIRFSSALRGVDVVHANSTRSAVYGAIALTGLQRGFVVHLRDMVTPDALGTTGHRLFTQVALRRADAVIANSSSTLESAQEYLHPRTQQYVVASASGLRRLPEAAKVSPQVRSVGMVARIDQWKGQHLLIEAFARADASTDCRLRLAGATPFGAESHLRELAALASSLGVADRVEFLGHVEDVNGFIDTLDICVQASVRAEPLGQNVLQYLARGKPTLVANAGGPAEWIRDGQNGVTFQMGSASDLAQKLRTLMQDRTLRTRVARGALNTAGLDDDSTIMQQHAEVFRGVARARGVEVS